MILHWIIVSIPYLQSALTSEYFKPGNQREELHSLLIFVYGDVKEFKIHSTQLISKWTQCNILSRNSFSLSYTQTSRLSCNSDFHHSLLYKKTLNADQNLIPLISILISPSCFCHFTYKYLTFSHSDLNAIHTRFISPSCVLRARLTDSPPLHRQKNSRCKSWRITLPHVLSNINNYCDRLNSQKKIKTKQ